jgi:hypothetical protein
VTGNLPTLANILFDTILYRGVPLAGAEVVPLILTHIIAIAIVITGYFCAHRVLDAYGRARHKRIVSVDSKRDGTNKD